jgi:hypothetical protein
MSRSRTLLIVCLIAVLAESLLRPRTSTAQASSPQLSDARTACASDVQKLCPSVPSGGGRILACLKQHKDEVSDGCKRAILKPWGNRAAMRVLPKVRLLRLPILLLQPPIRLPQRPVPLRLRLRLSTTTTPVLRQPPHQVRQVNRVCPVNRRATLPPLLQPSRENITS